MVYLTKINFCCEVKSLSGTELFFFVMLVVCSGGVEYLCGVFGNILLLTASLTLKIVCDRVNIGGFLLYDFERHFMIGIYSVADDGFTHFDEDLVICAIVLEKVVNCLSVIFCL
jgi:hypothetical protein